MNFEEALRYLLSLGHETVAVKLGLDNVARLLERLGAPQRAFPSVQVAGTNGKGSTAAMLDSILRAANLKTGLYTSPHLVSITERVRVRGREISREEFARAAAMVRRASEEVGREFGALPTFFEQLTAIALIIFRDSQVSLAVLETGMGGRLDATTAARAEFVAITPVALDHQEYLGGTLAEIAAEKAAIIRAGVRAAVVAPQEPEAMAIIERRCAECSVVPRRAAKDVSVEGADARGRLRVTLRTPRDEYRNVCLSLPGRHQTVNAAVAVALAEALAEEGFPVTHDAIINGLESATHAGRLEWNEALSPHVLYDGAHNASGARALREYLDEFVRSPVTLVFGAMRDKQLGEMAAALFPASARLILTRPDHPRAATEEEIIRHVPAATTSSTIELVPSVREALALAHSETPPGGVVCVTGSLYLVGEAKGVLEKADEESKA